MLKKGNLTETHNGWRNYYTWAVYTNITSYEWLYKKYNNMVEIVNIEGFKQVIRQDIKEGYFLDLHGLNNLEIKAIMQVLDIEEIYNTIKGL